MAFSKGTVAMITRSRIYALNGMIVRCVEYKGDILRDGVLMRQMWAIEPKIPVSDDRVIWALSESCMRRIGIPLGDDESLKFANVKRTGK